MPWKMRKATGWPPKKTCSGQNTLMAEIDICHTGAGKIHDERRHWQLNSLFGSAELDEVLNSGFNCILNR